jgi:Pyruvate/2-oxoacid:ferredoxin oxidoreductase gamma subunit
MIPVIVDDKEAARSPELAVFSAIAHGSDPHGSDVLHALLTAIRGIDPARATQYADVVLALLQGAAKHEWEDLLKTGTYEYQSDFARRYVAEGKAEGLAEAILDVLAARGFEVPSDMRARIEVCTDVAQLGTWIKQAVTCGSVRDLFD